MSLYNVGIWLFWVRVGFGKKVFKRRIQFKKGRLVCLLGLDLEREREREKKKNLYSIIFLVGKRGAFFQN